MPPSGDETPAYQREAFADTLAIAGTGLPEGRVGIAVRQFQRLMDVPGCAVTSVRPKSRTHKIVAADGYTAEMLHTIVDFVQSPLYRPAGRGAIPLWSTSPGFTSTPTVQNLLRPAGFREGTSVPVHAPDGSEVGSVHLNRFAEGLSGLQRESLSELTGFVGRMLQEQQRREAFGLSPRELEILRLIVNGATNPEIAEELFIARRTVATHIENILPKLGVRTRVAAAVIAVRGQLV